MNAVYESAVRFRTGQSTGPGVHGSHDLQSERHSGGGHVSICCVFFLFFWGRVGNGCTPHRLQMRLTSSHHWPTEGAAGTMENCIDRFGKEVRSVWSYTRGVGTHAIPRFTHTNQSQTAVASILCVFCCRPPAYIQTSHIPGYITFNL